MMTYTNILRICFRSLTRNVKIFNTQETICRLHPIRISRYAYSTEIDVSDPRTVPDSEWEKRLTAEQYAVCRERNTEAPFSGKYLNHYEKGSYHCICCDAELFSSKSKYDSHCGWPSFSAAVGTVEGDETHSHVLRRPDNSLGMVRTEVICKECDSHLGHVFGDGPPPTGQRFCINSVSLKFKSFRP